MCTPCKCLSVMLDFLSPAVSPPRNMSAYEVSSSQAVLSPQRSKRVKENTPPRCAVLQNGSSSGCGGGGWGGEGGGEAEQASSTTRDPPHQSQHHHHHHHGPRQTIVIPDTPSPAVSIITISSDTDDDDDHKQTNHRSDTRPAKLSVVPLCGNTPTREMKRHTKKLDRIVHSWNRKCYPNPCLLPGSSSSSSKHRKNVISCVTVRDSPDSDSSCNNSPYAVETRPGNNNNNNSYESKALLLDNCSSNGNPRSIIIPPLKSQAGELLSACERLMPGEGSGDVMCSRGPGKKSIHI